MPSFILSIALTFAPDVALLCRQLGDPVFRVRERADNTLQNRMSWALAVRLESVEAVNQEARQRLRRLVARYWADAYPDAMPYIDALSTRWCFGCDNRLTRYYFKRGASLCAPLSGTYPEFRAGTTALVADLVKWRIPPELVRPCLGAMAERSRLWDRR